MQYKMGLLLLTRISLFKKYNEHTVVTKAILKILSNQCACSFFQNCDIFFVIFLIAWHLGISNLFCSFVSYTALQIYLLLNLPL